MNAQTTRIEATGPIFDGFDGFKPVLRCPLTAEDCKGLITPQIGQMFKGARSLLNRAMAAEPTDFWLACEIDEAADLLMDAAFAQLCERYVDATHAAEDADYTDSMFTRKMNEPGY